LEDFDKLVDDINKNGLLQPIVVYQDKILDGNNRYRACMLAKVKPRVTELVEASDAQAQRYVISANIHRRHLDPKTRKEILETLLKLDPTKSNRQLGEETKLDHKTVGTVRAEMVAGGEIPHQEKTVGKDGVAQPTKTKRSGKGGKSKGSGKGKAITYQEVVDGKTARNAYHVLEEHLLDALQEINDRSSFDHADEYAQATIEKLQDKLSEMKPEDEKEAA
jgi:ParB-like chromosome segregation protein Spo0J